MKYNQQTNRAIAIYKRWDNNMENLETNFNSVWAINEAINKAWGPTCFQSSQPTTSLGN